MWVATRRPPISGNDLGQNFGRCGWATAACEWRTTSVASLRAAKLRLAQFCELQFDAKRIWTIKSASRRDAQAAAFGGRRPASNEAGFAGCDLTRKAVAIKKLSTRTATRQSCANRNLRQRRLAKRRSHSAGCARENDKHRYKKRAGREPRPARTKYNTISTLSLSRASPTPTPKPASRRACAPPSSRVRCWQATYRPRWPPHRLHGAAPPYS